MNVNDLPPVPYQEALAQGTPNNIAWLEWFRQIRDFIVKFDTYKTYGLFSCHTTQTQPSANTPKEITWTTHDVKDGIKYSGSKIIVPNAGLYRFNFSAQITSTSASTKNVWFWPRVNGLDVPGSTIKQTISSSDATLIVTRTGLFKLNPNDYLEALWATDVVGVELTAFPATAFAPATPSALLEVLQIG